MSRTVQMCMQSIPDTQTHRHNRMLFIVHLPHRLTIPQLPRKLLNSRCLPADHGLMGPDLTEQEEPASTTLHIDIEPELFSYNKPTKRALFFHQGMEQPKTCYAYKLYWLSHTRCAWKL